MLIEKFLLQNNYNKSNSLKLISSAYNFMERKAFEVLICV